jgi:site-specific recombinase XerD
VDDLKMPEKWEKLLEWSVVKDWMTSYPSQQTRADYLRVLFHLLEVLNLDPERFLALDPKEARAKTWSVIEDLVNKGQSSFAHLTKYGVASFYNYHHEDNPLEWKKRTHTVLVPLKKESKKKIPTHEEVWKMVDSAQKIRDKVIIALMYNTGLGHQAIVNLNYGDVRYQLNKEDYPLELHIDSRIYPKRFRSTKGGVSQYTVLFDRDCAELLRMYCAEFHKDSSDDTPLFRNQYGRRMDRSDIWYQVKKAIVKVYGGEEARVWPYLIRGAFYNRLIEKGMVDAHREYLMGHDLGIRRHYYDEKRSEIRECYLKCSFNRTEAVTDEVKKLRMELEQEKGKRLELADKLTGERLTQLFLEALENPQLRQHIVNVYKETIPPEAWPSIEEARKRRQREHGGAISPGSDCDIMVSKGQLPDYLKQGWRYVAKLSEDEIILRK